VTEAVFITLAFRPVGAFLFGMMADRFGRRVTLMVDIIAYSVFELASAFAPSLKVFIITRALFGIAMGGEWGVGAALAFETLPSEKRGFFSGLLQEGYAVGFLMAALVYGTAFQYMGWRGMFVIGALPAFLVIYIRARVDESPAWLQGRVAKKDAKKVAGGLGKNLLTFLGPFALMTVLMFAFNSFSHGTQDLYPTFLTKGHLLGPRAVMFVAIVANLGALAGDCDCGAAVDSGDSVVGVFAECADAGAGRISDAVHGAGGLGSDSGALERIVSAGGARNFSGVRLSAGKSSFI
jgi:SHS family lactate transporter-like MFS transporter